MSFQKIKLARGETGKIATVTLFNPERRNAIGPQMINELLHALDDLRSFRPDLVAVSAGFDAYLRDPLADGPLLAEDFYWLGQSLRKLDVPMFSLLEGGYSRDLPELIFAYLKGVEGK